MTIAVLFTSPARNFAFNLKQIERLHAGEPLRILTAGHGLSLEGAEIVKLPFSRFGLSARTQLSESLCDVSFVYFTVTHPVYTIFDLGTEYGNVLQMLLFVEPPVIAVDPYHRMFALKRRDILSVLLRKCRPVNYLLSLSYFLKFKIGVPV